MKNKVIKIVLLSFAMQIYSQGKYSDSFSFGKPSSERQTFIQQYKKSQGDDVDQMSQQELQEQLEKKEVLQGNCVGKIGESAGSEGQKAASIDEGISDEKDFQDRGLLTQCRLFLAKIIHYLFG